MLNNNQVYDKLVVGGGIAGLATAYEILRASKEEGRPITLSVLTDKISAPSQAGTNIVFGIDGFEEGELPPHATELNNLVRRGLHRILQIIREEKIDCRADMYYQMVAPTKGENQEVVDFLVNRFGYKQEELREVKNPANRLHFKGLSEAVETSVIGQLNGPELLRGIVAAIRRMGGEVIENARYTDHQKRGQLVEVNTSAGTYQTSSPVMLAGGPHLMSKIADLPVPVTPMYTMAMHVQLSPEDAKKISLRPVAFFNPNFEYLWGSLDSKGVLTMGQGDTDNPADAAQIEAGLRQTFNTLLPDFKGKYDDKIKISFNAMAITPNMLPIVGRLADFDVITGNCSRGFAQSFAEARAYADYFVRGDDNKLQMFESLNMATPQIPAARPKQGAKPTNG